MSRFYIDNVRFCPYCNRGIKEVTDRFKTEHLNQDTEADFDSTYDWCMCLSCGNYLYKNIGRYVWEFKGDPIPKISDTTANIYRTLLKNGNSGLLTESMDYALRTLSKLAHQPSTNAIKNDDTDKKTFIKCAAIWYPNIESKSKEGIPLYLPKNITEGIVI